MALAGAADELMFPERYQDAVGQRAAVKLIEGVNHMGIVSDPAAVSAIADDIAKAASGSCRAAAASTCSLHIG